MNLSVIALVFGVIFISELPDKSMIASLILGMRYRGLYVWAGAAAAFLTHVIIAVSAGKLLILLPHRVLEAVIGAMFLAGALLLFFGKHGLENDPEPGEVAAHVKASKNFWKVFAAAYSVIFLGEWGDITQIATANYTARYHDALSVGIGATLALWAVTAIGVVAGKRLLTVIPAKLLLRITAIILLVFALISLSAVVRR
jgi:Ca2+/H+ antiporter, TMEM165/GDT1 family